MTFQTVCKHLLTIFAVRAKSKFQFVRAAVSKFFPKQLLQNKPHKKPQLSLSCFVTFYTSESSNRRFRLQTTKLLYLT